MSRCGSVTRISTPGSADAKRHILQAIHITKPIRLRFLRNCTDEVQEHNMAMRWSQGLSIQPSELEIPGVDLSEAAVDAAKGHGVFDDFDD